VELGVFAKTFPRETPDAVLDAVGDHGFACAQWNMSCAGLPPMPDEIDPALAERVGRAAERHGVRLAAVSGTFNTVHPDPEQRKAGLRRLRVLAEAAPLMGTGTITLSTGTRDPEDTWRHHPDNGTPQVWRDLLNTLSEALGIAEEHGVTLAFEPEVNNVIDSARKGRQLLDVMASPRLKVVIDASNLFRPGELKAAPRVLAEALCLLEADLVMAHAKDLTASGEVAAVGEGDLDFDLYLGLLQEAGFDGPLVLHGLSEEEVPASAAFLRQRLTGEAR
jgi:sugar phosphate isomerase/epimerase